MSSPEQQSSSKSQAVAFIPSMFLGIFGADRFYLGYTGLGVLKLITCGGVCVWALIDFVLIGIGAMKDAQGLPLSRGPVVGKPVKSQTATFLLAWLLGPFGADRFYLGDTGLAILKLITCGGFSIWSLIDLILTGMGDRRDKNGNSLRYG